MPERSSSPDHSTEGLLPQGGSPGASPHGRPGLAGEAPGDQIGPYRLLQVLGEGGFGVVYLAERREPMVQRVAIKIVKPGMDSRAVVARFEQERQALAVMDHPHVARVLDGGVTPSGRPYFVMEHVKGDPITRFADRERLTIKQRLELFLPVCEAVHHAHMKGIIHRDLKPSNILVNPGAEGRSPIVKVIDFGVAKAISHTLTDKTIFTEQGQIIGTPEYMSPEQAEMGATDIDTRADVYSLGVVLYELLSGTLPFEAKSLRAAGYAEIQRIIREVDAPRPSTKLNTTDDQTGAAIAKARLADRERIASELRRELEWIPLKALRKDRARRYASAESLGADVRRYLDGKPLEAAPESRAYLFRKFVRRNRATVFAGCAVAIALLAGAGATFWQARVAAARADEAAASRDIATAQRAEAEAQRALANESRERAERNRQIANATTEFMLDILSTNEGSYADQTTVLQAINRAAATLDARLADDAVVRAAAWSAIGRSYSRIGQWELARQSLQRALPVLEKELGLAHEQTRRTLIELSSVALSEGDPAQAEAHILRVLATVGDPDLIDLVRPTSKLAQIMLETDRVADAQRLTSGLLKKLEIDVESIQKADDLPAIHRGNFRVSHLIANYAEARRRVGDIQGAHRLLLITLEQLPASTHPVQHAWTLADLGRIQMALGNHQAALKLLQDARPRLERRFGPEHFRVRQLVADIAECERRVQPGPGDAAPDSR
jgi:serine/threonine protein kinase